MTTKETFRERQENELEVLKSIFGNDVIDLRAKNNNEWTPLNVEISLVPQRGSSGQKEAYAKTKLHVCCPAKYPKLTPKITLEASNGLSDVQINEMIKHLNKLAYDKRGEVMVFDLAQLVQKFLHKYNKPPPVSFYDERLLEKMERDKQLLQLEELKIYQEQQNIRDGVLKRQEILKNESKLRRGETRKSMSENSPKHRTTSSSDSSENSMRHVSNECTEHRTSDTLYVTNVGRKILKGCCLSHSQKGCVAFSGIDVETGQLLYITEWNIKYTQLESKCIGHCNRSGDSKCVGHSVDEIIQNIEKQVISLSQLRHKNLITYECVLAMKKKEGIVIYLVQDFVLGTSVSSISGTLGWCAEGASMVAKGVLDALIMLHNNGISHNNLYDSTVIMDNAGTIRVTDYSLIPQLFELVDGGKHTQGDLPALGALLESLLPTPHSEMRDFIENCTSKRTLSTSDLLCHPFLRKDFPIEINVQTKVKLAYNAPTVERSLTNVTVHAPTTGHSRLHTEFEVLQWLGQGAYGDVLKVRNILDNRQYALKRIPLTRRSRQMFKKMTREVELLSRLNHENVVRYYNSWIESGLESDDKIGGSGDFSISHQSIKPPQLSKVIETVESSSSNDWMGITQNVADDSSSDGIEFVNSNGEICELEDDDESQNNLKENSDSNNFKSPKLEIQNMYIQMEFCEKSTLRTAIDNQLYKDIDRLWRFFREIAEGLSHIHQQGMIHRDLKPVNIFLDSRDQVKIGDFGLATTNFLALQSQEHNLSNNYQEIGNSLTGKVGTALYVAPELTGNASKSTYNQKVDLYSLGIILFEMSNPPFETGMERVNVIVELRSKAIIIPKNMLNDSQYSQNIEVIKWLLHHDQSQRPTAEELLSSELVPPAHLEANELQEMLRNALANTQSKSYKHLVARCLDQQSDTVLELTYHFGLVPISSKLEFTKNKIIALFRKHGGVEVETPILAPFVKNSHINNSMVRLMTHSGSVVTLPHDLRVPFAKHIALNGINLLRRYSVARVYREKKLFNFHPKQLYECAFDIITPNPGNLLVDAEIISMAYEITNDIQLLQKNLTFRVNHTSLLRAILLFCNVPIERYQELFARLLDFNEGRISKFLLQSSVTPIMQTSKFSATSLIDLLLTDIQFGNKSNITGSSLRTLIRGRGEAASLAKGAIRELESVLMLAKGMGVNCPLHIFAGLPIGYNRAKTGGIVWQMIGDLKSNRCTNYNVLAVGGRYDGMLAEFQQQAQNVGVSIPNREISGVGFSFALDKIVSALNQYRLDDFEEYHSIDVVVCVTGSRPPLRDVTQVLRSLWAAGIRCGIVESNGVNEVQDMAKDLGASHLILFGDDGLLRVRSYDQDRFQERFINRQELIDYMQKMLRTADSNLLNDNQINNQNSSINYTNNTAAAVQTIKSINILSGPILPTIDVIFVTQEKLTANMRRRYENQVKQHMTDVLSKFVKKERVIIFVVELPLLVLKMLCGALDPRQINHKVTDEEIVIITDRFPKYKRYIKDIIQEITDILEDEQRNSPIFSLCSIIDFSYRMIL